MEKIFNWDKEELLNYYNYLCKCERPENPTYYKMLVHDLEVTKELLKELGIKPKINKTYFNPFVFENNLDKVKLYNLFPLTHILPKVNFYNKKIEIINDDAFEEMLEVFLSEFDNNLYNNYKKLVKENLIFLSRKKININGYVQNLCIFNKTYMYLKNDKFKYITLVHELGHMEQFKLCENNINIIENLYRTNFIEFYSKYLELKFINFLENNNYKLFALKWKSSFLLYNTLYSEILASNLNDNKILKNYIANLLAFTFLEEDKKIVTEINNYICYNNDDSILKYLETLTNKTKISKKTLEFYNKFNRELRK